MPGSYEPPGRLSLADPARWRNGGIRGAWLDVTEKLSRSPEAFGVRGGAPRFMAFKWARSAALGWCWQVELARAGCTSTGLLSGIWSTALGKPSPRSRNSLNDGNTSIGNGEFHHDVRMTACERRRRGRIALSSCGGRAGLREAGERSSGCRVRHAKLRSVHNNDCIDLRNTRW